MSRAILRFAFIRNGLNRPRGICRALSDATVRLESAIYPSPKGRDGSPGLWRAIVGALLGLLVAIGAYTYLVGQRDEALRGAEIEVRNRSLMLGEWVGAIFR